MILEMIYQISQIENFFLETENLIDVQNNSEIEQKFKEVFFC